MPPHAPPNGGAASFRSPGSSRNGSDPRRSLRLIHALIDQARRWSRHVLAKTDLDPAYVVEKALAAIAFTIRVIARRYDTPDYGTTQEPCSWNKGQTDRPVVLSVPTKLVGVAAVQDNVRALRAEAEPGELLAARLCRPSCTKSPGRSGTTGCSENGCTRSTQGILVSWRGRPIGRIQDKHVPWLAALLPDRASVHLIAVTGDEAKGHTLGVNVYVRIEATL